jgi:hypothetical protein
MARVETRRILIGILIPGNPYYTNTIVVYHTLTDVAEPAVN